MYLGLISLSSIFNFLGCVAEEMVGLALHRTKSALHPSHPFHYLPVPASPSTSVLWRQWIGDGLIRVKRERYLIIFIVFLTQIKHDSLPFEDSLLTSLSFGSGCSVDYCRDTTIRCWDYQYLCFKTSGIYVALLIYTWRSEEEKRAWSCDRWKRVQNVRLIFKYQSSFCTFFEISTCVVSYLIPSSSSVIEIFWPLGVPDVYKLSCT